MIHLFRHEFPEQVRGFTPLNACLNDLKQLEDFQTAELMAAKVSAVLSIFYERNGQAQTGDVSGPERLLREVRDSGPS